jgi:hypothetical protein
MRQIWIAIEQASQLDHLYPRVASQHNRQLALHGFTFLCLITNEYSQKRLPKMEMTPISRRGVVKGSKILSHIFFKTAVVIYNNLHISPPMTNLCLTILQNLGNIGLCTIKIL